MKNLPVMEVDVDSIGVLVTIYHFKIVNRRIHIDYIICYKFLNDLTSTGNFIDASKRHLIHLDSKLLN